MRYWLGLGSNLGDSAGLIGNALKRIDRLADCEVLRASRFYRTKPQGSRSQPDFVNAVAEVDCGLEAAELLCVLQSMERDLGRVRHGPRWGPRHMDIDILLAGDRILHFPGLVIPHPRMHRRRFVLEPLADLEPGLVIPARGRVDWLLQGLSEQGVKPLDQPR